MAWQHADTDTCCGNLSRAWTSPGTTGIRCAPGRQPTGRRSRMRRTCRTWSPTGEGKTVCVSPRLSSLLFRLSSSHLSPPSLLLSSHLISHLLSLLSLSLSPPSLSSNSLVDAQELEKGSVGSQSYWNRRGGRRRRAVGRGGESKEQLPPLLLLFLLRLLLLPHPLLPLLLLTVRRRVLSRCSTSSTLPAFIHSFHSFF